MAQGEPISALMFGTLIIGALIALFLLLHFLRKPQNRHPMAGEPDRNIGEALDHVEPIQEHPTRNAQSQR